MENRNGITEIGSHKPQQLGGQRNLRNQKHCLLPGFQGALNEFNIHSGLTGTGNTVKKGRTGFFPVHLPA